MVVLQQQCDNAT